MKFKGTTPSKVKMVILHSYVNVNQMVFLLDLVDTAWLAGKLREFTSHVGL
jgi:hypothetical protein